jgi:hypothetical protein
MLLPDKLKEKYQMLKGVTYKDVRFLKKELRSMRAMVGMVGQMRLDNCNCFMVKVSTDHLRETSYDTEDILACITVHTDGIENVPCFKGLMENITNFFSKYKTRYQIAAATEKMKTIIRDAADRHNRYRYRIDRPFLRPPEPNTRIRNQMALCHEFTDLVGIDGAMDDLTKSLGMDERDGVSNQQLKIVSVFGIGGVGKTTLASQVYQKLESQFSFTAFVFLSSPNPDMRAVSGDMLEQLQGGRRHHDGGLSDQTKVVRQLHEFLQNKRYASHNASHPMCASIFQIAVLIKYVNINGICLRCHFG